MHRMKTFITAIIICSALSSCSAQTDRTDCSKDSVAYKLLLDYMQSDSDIDVDLYVWATHFSSLFLYSPEKRNCYCDLLIYVRIFDHLLQNGLDPNYKFQLVFTYSTYPPPDSSQVAEMHRRSFQNNLFRNFLAFKKLYETNVVDKYEQEKHLSLVKDVNRILQSNVYSRPNDLKHILLSKNAQSLEDKYKGEIEAILGKD